VRIIQPQRDSYCDWPCDIWGPISLAAGAEPNAYGHDGSFLWNTDISVDDSLNMPVPSSVRRNLQRTCSNTPPPPPQNPDALSLSPTGKRFLRSQQLPDTPAPDETMCYIARWPERW
jgi:hypothetical protein